MSRATHSPAVRRHPNAWTQDQADFVRAHVGTMSHAEIGGAIGRTAKAVKAYAMVHGIIGNRRRWTEEEKAVVRSRFRKDPTPQIAKDLGRKPHQVYACARVMGLCIPQAIRTPEFEAYLREKHAAGWTDCEIAESKPGVDRHAVTHLRKKLGLPANTFSEHRRQRVSQKTREQLDAAGLPTLAALRAQVFRDRARAAGWPEDLRPRHVQILNALWDNGPMTRMQIAEAIGARTDYAPKHRIRKILLSNDPEGSYLAHLMKRGLVISLGRRAQVLGQGRGKSVFIYSLPLTIQRKVPHAHDQRSADPAA